MCDSCIDTNILLDKIDVVNYLSQYLDLTREGEEYFAYKRVLINKEQYYEKIFVEYAYTMGDYVKIFSDKLKKGNVVISL